MGDKDYRFMHNCNREIYNSLVLYRYHSKLNNYLLNSVTSSLHEKDEDKKRTLAKKLYLELLENVNENTQFKTKFPYLRAEIVANELYLIYELTAKILISEQYSPFLASIKPYIWINKSPNLLTSVTVFKAGTFLILSEFIKQTSETISGKYFDDEKVNKYYALASEINEYFKVLTEEQYGDITAHFNIFKIDEENGKCYYDLGSEKKYIDKNEE